MNVSAEILKPLRFQEFKLEKPRISSRKSSQSGQAVLEYILILVISVGLVLGIMYQFNTAFKKYVQSYFGNYIACLLETGELPSLYGGDAVGGPNAESCGSQFEKFSLQNGRPLKTSVGGDGSSSASSNSKGSSSSKGSNAGNGRKGGRATGARASTSNSGAALNAESGSSKSSDTTQKVRKGGRNGGAGGDSGSAYSSKRYRDGSTYGLSGKFKTGEDKDKGPAIRKVSARGNAGDGSSGKKQLVRLDDLKRKPAQQSDGGWDLSFGDYLRYIIIFGILVVILIFFGGQIFQLRKSWDSK